MICESKGFAKGYIAALLILSALSMGFGLVSGCNSQTIAPDREPALSAISDRETYLLSLLKERYGSPDVHCELGRYYHSVGNWEKAQHHFDVALSFDPAHRKSQAALVRMLVDKGDRAGADRTAEKFKKQLALTPLELISLSKALRQESLDAYGLDCLNEAARLAPNRPEPHKELGLYYLAKGDKTQAAQHLRWSFGLDPVQPDVAAELGRLGIVVETPRPQGMMH